MGKCQSFTEYKAIERKIVAEYKDFIENAWDKVERGELSFDEFNTMKDAMIKRKNEIMGKAWQEAHARTNRRHISTSADRGER